jgi:hypothetical protein
MYNKIDRAAPLLLGLLILTGCKDDKGDGDCIDLSGTWEMTEHCEGGEVGGVYEVEQDGCDLTITSTASYEKDRKH